MQQITDLWYGIYGITGRERAFELVRIYEKIISELRTKNMAIYGITET